MLTVTIEEEIIIANVPLTGLLNQAITEGTDNNGNTVNDDSDNGSNPLNDTDEPTPLDFGPIPALEKALLDVPVQLSNGNFQLTYDFLLENNGTSEMCLIDVLEDLAAQYGLSLIHI